MRAAYGFGRIGTRGPGVAAYGFGKFLIDLAGYARVAFSKRRAEVSC